MGVSIVELIVITGTPAIDARTSIVPSACSTSTVLKILGVP